MNKKQKEQIRLEFLEAMSKKVVMVNGDGYSIPLNEYADQEKWARPIKEYIPEFIEKGIDNTQYSDLGILSPESIFETEIWYWRNKGGRNLSVRNSRRIGRR